MAYAQSYLTLGAEFWTYNCFVYFKLNGEGEAQRQVLKIGFLAGAIIVIHLKKEAIVVFKEY